MIRDYKTARYRSAEPKRGRHLVVLGTVFGVALGGLMFTADVGGVPERPSGPALQEPVDALPLTLPAPTVADELAEVSVDPDATLVLEVRRGDSLARLFDRHGLDRRDLAEMMGIDQVEENLVLLRPGDRVHIVAEGGRVMSLERRIDDATRLRVTREGERFRSELLNESLERRVAVARGVIRDSLYAAGLASGLKDGMIMRLAGLFAWDIDFALDIRTGDNFVVIYEELWRDGRYLRDGGIIAAEFVNQGQAFHVLRYVNPDGDTDFYTPDGLSIRKAFLRAPVDFRRISSSFNPNRLHPVLKTRRPHRGVDYAADKGTPIWAAGDGTIIHRGSKGGYGNTVILQHGDNITTLYAHLSSFKRGHRVGSKVKQGEVIGYVGDTGLVTAAHLHFEFRKDGVHRNPRTVDLPEAEPVPQELASDFTRQSSPLVAQLDRVRRSSLAPAE